MTGEIVTTDTGDSSSAGVEKPKVGNVLLSDMLKSARDIVEDRTKDWEITSLKAEERIPRFFRDGTCSLFRSSGSCRFGCFNGGFCESSTH